MAPADSEVPKWVVYAAFRSDGDRSPHVVDQLLDYGRAGWSTLVVDASPSISAEREGDWTRMATAWMRRPNIGYDFFSYRDGMAHLGSGLGVDIDRAHLIVANDSCFGPFFPIQEVVARLDERHRQREGGEPVVYGITDSYEFHHHLQSYWLYCRPPAVSMVRTFLENLPPIEGVQDAIHRGELGLSRFLTERGCALSALCPTREIIPKFARSHRRPLSILEFGLRRRWHRPRYDSDTDRACMKYLRGRPNPFAEINISVGLGVEMLQAGMTPFLKRRLLSDNPYGARSIPPGLRVDALSNQDVARMFQVGER